MTFADLVAGEAIFLDANPFGNSRYAAGVRNGEIAIAPAP
jgi:hypothetical protein